MFVEIILRILTHSLECEFKRSVPLLSTFKKEGLYAIYFRFKYSYTLRESFLNDWLTALVVTYLAVLSSQCPWWNVWDSIFKANLIFCANSFKIDSKNNWGITDIVASNQVDLGQGRKQCHILLAFMLPNKLWYNYINFEKGNV